MSASAISLPGSKTSKHSGGREPISRNSSRYARHQGPGRLKSLRSIPMGRSIPGTCAQGRARRIPRAGTATRHLAHGWQSTGSSIQVRGSACLKALSSTAPHASISNDRQIPATKSVLPSEASRASWQRVACTCDIAAPWAREGRIRRSETIAGESILHLDNVSGSLPDKEVGKTRAVMRSQL
jgi:hypothetical protein